MEKGFVDISKEQDRGLLKKILVEGHGEETPNPGSSVVVHYVGTLHEDGSMFDSSRDRDSHFKFEVGVGQVIKGWDMGILTMKRGEKCILRCRSDYGYGKHGSPPKIPGDATLNFEVELFSWKEKVKAPWEMILEERRAHATRMDKAGIKAFKRGDYATAINRFEDGVKYITYDANSDDFGQGEHGHSHCGSPGYAHDDGEKGEPVVLSESDKQLAIALLNNSAMAHLKNGEPESAKFDCTKALQYDPKNVVATFYREQAEFALHKACLDDASTTLGEPEDLPSEWENEDSPPGWETVIAGFRGGLGLKTAVEDAKRVAKTVKGLGLCEDPLLLIDEEEEIGKDDLRRVIEVAVERLKKGGKKNLLVYVGCHGNRDGGLTVILPKGHDHPQELLILEKVVVDTLAEKDCHAINVLVISAACGESVMSIGSEELRMAYIHALGGPPRLDPRGNNFVAQSQTLAIDCAL